VNEPAVGNVLVNVAPGPIEPESHAPLSAVDVCVVESLFIHVTLPPTATEIGFGEYAVVVRTDAPLTMETGVPPEAGGVFDGEVDDEPQPKENDKIAPAIMSRLIMVTSLVSAYLMFKFLAVGLSACAQRVTGRIVG